MRQAGSLVKGLNTEYLLADRGYGTYTLIVRVKKHGMQSVISSRKESRAMQQLRAVDNNKPIRLESRQSERGQAGWLAQPSPLNGGTLNPRGSRQLASARLRLDRVRVLLLTGPVQHNECAPTFHGTDMTPNHTLVTELTLSRVAINNLLNSETSPLRFEHCIFDGEDLSRLDLRGCVFVRCSIAGASFSRALLNDSEWHNCKAGGCDFSLADLTDSHFKNSDLNNSNWTRSLLAAVNFDGVKLTGATIVEIRGLGLTFLNTLLVGADLRGMSFRKQRLIGLDFSTADLSGCDFRDATFEGGSLRDANLRHTRFEGADLREAILGTLTMEQVSNFKRAVISHEQAAILAASMGMLVV